MFFTIVAMAFPLQREGLKSIRQTGEIMSEDGRSRFRDLRRNEIISASCTAKPP